jgi:hypothetical protein
MSTGKTRAVEAESRPMSKLIKLALRGPDTRRHVWTRWRAWWLKAI